MAEEVNYQAALDYVLSFADYERVSRSAVVFDISRIEELLKRLGNPQRVARSIHIAGTKGKGSVSAMIAAVLLASGYRTGLYTSPHLHTIRERIKVDGSPIGEEEFAVIVEGLKSEVEAINRLGNLGELTTFEILTALAFVYFREKGVDFQVLETGLGGRLDATNVVKPEVCAITSISFDHTEVLGDTLAQIAREKAGIIKPGSIVVCAPQPPEALMAIEKVCQERGARLIRVGEEVTWRRNKFNLSGQSFQLKGLRGEYDLTIPLLGEHQLENAAIAVAALEVLTNLGARVSPESIATGLSRVVWPGRLQILQHSPLFVVDGAHNAYSARKLSEALKQYFDFDDVIIIVGISQDKDIAGIVAELSAIPGKVIVAPSRHPRAAAASRLVGEFSKWGVKPQVAENVASAVDIAMAEAKPRDLICATGSLFVVAEVIEYLKGLPQEQYPV
ncbi:MAG TPA: folylpolyglutamate synthase/dihydrofolate synthase family protein [Dehalococcoidia bacterium]|nr:folylpolyglutamate synthase/dihydrofolate synthase family protein [Dehalococcoidia bacterium]